MRKTLIVTFLIIQLYSHAQWDRSMFAVSIGAHQQTLGNNSAFGFGGQIEWNVNDIVSLNYPIYIVYNYPRENFFLTTGWPQAVGIFWASIAGNNNVGAFGLLLAIIPESISFYLPLNDYNSIIPYFSAYSVDFMKIENDTEGADFKTSMRLGFKYRHRFTDDSWDIMPRFGAKWIYGRYGGIGLEVGLDFVIRPKPIKGPFYYLRN